MAKTQVVTEEMINAALLLLEKRIAEPPSAAIRTYSRRDAFLKLRGRAREALAAGHSLETVLDDLKGIGIGMTISIARHYLKPGRSAKKHAGTSPHEARNTKPPTSSPITGEARKPKGTFTVTEDEKDI